MKFVLRTEGEMDEAAVRMDLLDISLILQAMLAAQLGRGVQEGVAAGIFDALADGPTTVAEIAARCGLEQRATEPLMQALATTGYALHHEGRHELTDLGRRWLIGRGRDIVLGGTLDVAWATDFEAFLKTDAVVPVLDRMTPERWTTHARAQRELARARSEALVANVPLRKGASSILDIGAAHGHRAATLCREHEGLTATVLDFPQAIEAGATLRAEEGMGARITTRAEDPRTADLGTGAHDAVLLSWPLGGVSAVDAARLVHDAARALRPGGALVVDDFFAPSRPGEGGQQSALVALLHSLTTAEGPFTADQVDGWLRAAGLDPLPLVATMGAIAALKIARKPGGPAR
jgi:SAM-dependent methyltransferase